MTTSYSNVNSLDEFTIIGGNDFTFSFSITEDGLPVNLTGSTLLLKIAPYGQPNNVITTITGSIGSTTDIAEFILSSNTSEQMVGGKYMYQPIIQDTGGTIHRPKQGTFLLVQAIGAFSEVIEVPDAVYYIYGQGTNSYTSTNTTITSYYAGLSIVLHVQNTNSANSTLELSGVVGTKNLMKFDTSGNKVILVAGDLLINKKYLFTYDGTEWVLVGTPKSDGLVTNGDLHDHNGGDGAQVSHLNLSNIGTNTHAQIDTFIGTTVPTTYAPLASPTFTGDPKAPTASVGDNDTSIATTAFVNAEITNDRPYSDTNPIMNGTATQGSSARISRQDHVHPTDTSRAPLASPTFTGTPAAPTASVGTNTTQIATTAFVLANIKYGLIFITHGQATSVPSASTRYMIPNMMQVQASSYSIPMPAGKFKNLFVRQAGSQPGDGSLTFKLFAGPVGTLVDTGIGVTFTAGSSGTDRTDVVNTYTHTSGEHIQFVLVNNSPTGASAVIGGVTIEFERTS